MQFEKTLPIPTIDTLGILTHRSLMANGKSEPITLFLCGDVMTGRGVDQVLPHPSNPRIHERNMKNAGGYLEIAEKMNGPIKKPVDFSYIWGDALEELKRLAPDVRIINLETAVTKSDDYWKGKGINYRMHPKNIPCITAAKIDCCALANNHVLDWGYSGLAETLETLRKAGLKTVGAGENIKEAEAPALLEVPGKGRVLVFSFGRETSGIPEAWAAETNRPGVFLLWNLWDRNVRRVAKTVRKVKRQGDIVVASIHWGTNWGYKIRRIQKKFAHKLIDEADVDIVHGHSSHHPRPMEVYHEKPILYGCGDFLNDYEGISGHREYRGDLGLMFFITMDPTTGNLGDFHLIPTQIRHFKVHRASQEDVRWLGAVLNRECMEFGTRVEMNEDKTFSVRWK
jgi:poly-gamma-glutamate synthesis protein (capsule biosynthesis protein)